MHKLVATVIVCLVCFHSHYVSCAADRTYNRKFGTRCVPHNGWYQCITSTATQSIPGCLLLPSDRVLDVTGSAICALKALNNFLVSQALEVEAQNVEAEILHSEQETQRLLNSAQTLLTLIIRFEDHLSQLSALAALEEPASLPASDEPLPVKEESTSAAISRPLSDTATSRPLPAKEESTAVATTRPLIDPIKDMNHHRQGIAVIRKKFNKVR